jgi:phage terminase small subunit
MTVEAPAGSLTAAEPPPPPPLPEDFGPAGRRLWEAVTKVFVLDPHTLATLESACRELDRAHAAEQALARAGEYLTDRYGSPKQHPAVAVARSSRLAAARLVQALDLPAKETS